MTKFTIKIYITKSRYFIKFKNCEVPKKENKENTYKKIFELEKPKNVG
jgi:hypothetical protein